MKKYTTPEMELLFLSMMDVMAASDEGGSNVPVDDPNETDQDLIIGNLTML